MLTDMSCICLFRQMHIVDLTIEEVKPDFFLTWRSSQIFF